MRSRFSLLFDRLSKVEQRETVGRDVQNTSCIASTSASVSAPLDQRCVPHLPPSPHGRLGRGGVSGNPGGALADFVATGGGMVVRVERPPLVKKNGDTLLLNFGGKPLSRKRSNLPLSLAGHRKTPARKLASERTLHFC